MFASATSGDRPNNSKFSSCSIANISSVLDAIQDNKKRNCFKGLYKFFFSVFSFNRRRRGSIAKAVPAAPNLNNNNKCFYKN